MSTRAHVLVEQPNHEIKGVYVHNSGDTLLPILKKYYGTKTKRDALIKLGDLSVLSAKTSKPPKGMEHTIAKGIPGYCVAYHRDRGDKKTGLEFKSWKSYKRWQYRELDRGLFHIEYVYLWDVNGSWFRYERVCVGDKFGFV